MGNRTASGDGASNIPAIHIPASANIAVDITLDIDTVTGAHLEQIEISLNDDINLLEIAVLGTALTVDENIAIDDVDEAAAGDVYASPVYSDGAHKNTSFKINPTKELFVVSKSPSVQLKPRLSSKQLLTKTPNYCNYSILCLCCLMQDCDIIKP